jgi:hypothetical protein
MDIKCGSHRTPITFVPAMDNVGSEGSDDREYQTARELAIDTVGYHVLISAVSYP